MKNTGIFISKQELKNLKIEIECSGMCLSGGLPMGDPRNYVFELNKKYNLIGHAINSQTGEFIKP